MRCAACEPEAHINRLNCWNNENILEFAKAHWGQGKVRNGEECSPYCICKYEDSYGVKQQETAEYCPVLVLFHSDDMGTEVDEQ